MKTINIIYRSILALMLLLCAACGTTKKVQEVTENNAEKTIEKIVLYKDTIIYSPYAKADLIFPKAVLKTDTDWIYKSQNNQAKVQINAIGDTLYVSAQCDSLALVAKIKQEYYTLIEKNNRSQSITTKEKATSIYSLLVAFFIGFGLGVVAKYAVRLIRIIT